MTKDEILTMRFGEMQDLITCMAIEDGGAEQIIKKRIPFEQIMRLE